MNNTTLSLTRLKKIFALNVLKKILLVAVFVVVTMLLAPDKSAAQSLSGKWKAKIIGGERFSLVLRRDGSKLSGTCDGRELSGSVEDGRIFHFKVAPYKDAQGRTISKFYDGHLEDSGITGQFDIITGVLTIYTASDRVQYQWNAERDK